MANIGNTATTLSSLMLFYIMCPAQQNCVVVRLIPSWVTGLGPLGIEQVLPFNIKPSLRTELDKTAQ